MGRISFSIALLITLTCQYVHGFQPGYFLNVTEPPCSLDNTGTRDVTAALQKCIDTSFADFALPSIPLFFPPGRYLVSDTITAKQTSGWKSWTDDGINICPSRFVAYSLIGSRSASPARPTIVLAANSNGFGNPSNRKTVLRIYNNDNDNINMNNILMGIDVDLTLPGNPGAVGVSHGGAQGATVQDVTVRATPDTFACFSGLTGAGGFHANIECYGARYGVYNDNSQPVPSLIASTFVNQTISALIYAPGGQESLSFVGNRIVVHPNASGPAISINENGARGASIVDSIITCPSSRVSHTAISTSQSLFLRDVYISGCSVAVAQSHAAPLPGTNSTSQFVHVHTWAAGVQSGPWYNSNVTYANGVRKLGGSVRDVEIVPATSIPDDLLSRHAWTALSVPLADDPVELGTVNAMKDCGAAGDNVTDDTAALQRCVDTHRRVFFPPGMYRIQAPLQLPPGTALGGMGNAATYILASTRGFPNATADTPLPLIRTSDADANDSPTVIALIGLVTWQHLAHVYTLDWRSRNPLSTWRSNFESRNCECLWMSAYQHTSPPALPCSLPNNLTIAKTLVRGLGRFYAFLNDDTGAILSTGATYRSIAVRDTSAFATTPALATRFYAFNLEHGQSEANSEIQNASNVIIYALKSEGNLPLIWIRKNSVNVSVLALGGGVCPHAYNFTYPSDFTQVAPSLFRVDAETSNIEFATLLDHGYGASAPYWPPTSATCSWKRGYPYPGEAIPFYPYSTFPNVTMWNCWYGDRPATVYWYMITDGGLSQNWTTPTDKPIYYFRP